MEGIEVVKGTDDGEVIKVKEMTMDVAFVTMLALLPLPLLLSLLLSLLLPLLLTLLLLLGLWTLEEFIIATLISKLFFQDQRGLDRLQKRAGNWH